jgi:hypothetical protein
MTEGTTMTDSNDILAALASRVTPASKTTDAVTLADIAASGDGLTNLQAIAGKARPSDVDAVTDAVVNLTGARLRAFGAACLDLADRVDAGTVRVSTRDGLKCTTTVMVKYTDPGADRDAYSALNFSMPESFAPVYAPSAKRTGK